MSIKTNYLLVNTQRIFRFQLFGVQSNSSVKVKFKFINFIVSRLKYIKYIQAKIQNTSEIY